MQYIIQSIITYINLNICRIVSEDWDEFVRSVQVKKNKIKNKLVSISIVSEIGINAGRVRGPVVSRYGRQSPECLARRKRLARRARGLSRAVARVPFRATPSPGPHRRAGVFAHGACPPVHPSVRTSIGLRDASRKIYLNKFRCPSAT